MNVCTFRFSRCILTGATKLTEFVLLSQLPCLGLISIAVVSFFLCDYIIIIIIIIHHYSNGINFLLSVYYLCALFLLFS